MKNHRHAVYHCLQKPLNPSLFKMCFVTRVFDFKTRVFADVSSLGCPILLLCCLCRQAHPIKALTEEDSRCTLRCPSEKWVPMSSKNDPQVSFALWGFPAFSRNCPRQSTQQHNPVPLQQRSYLINALRILSGNSYLGLQKLICFRFGQAKLLESTALL